MVARRIELSSSRWWLPGVALFALGCMTQAG
jgi:hypothetical protein